MNTRSLKRRHIQSYSFTTIHIESFSLCAEDISTLAHEITHFVDRFIERRGFDTKVSGTEFRAYYTDFWIKSFIRQWDKITNKK